jgi:hypothetical protein
MNATLHIHVRVALPVLAAEAADPAERERLARLVVDRIDREAMFGYQRTELISVHATTPARPEGAEFPALASEARV